MIEGLKPYPEYNSSALPWLGEVPSHWQKLPAFGAYSPIQEKNIGNMEKTVLSLSYGRIVIKPPEKLHGLVPSSFATYQIVNPGDIIIRTTDLQNDHTSLRIGMVRNRGIITSAYLALRPKQGVNAEYAYQFLNVWDQSKAIYGYGSGLRQNLDFSHFKRMPVALPPPDEQTAIIRFLSHANWKISRFIRAKRNLITLLEEQKQAIIHRAVTRGLNSDVPLKPSGVPWLGDIPKHWDQHSLWTLCTLRAGRNPGNLQLLSVFLNRGVIRYDEGGGQVHAPSLDMSKYQVVVPGDFVLNNQQAWRGSVGVSFHHGIISPAYIVLQLSAKLDPTFANYLMRSRVMVDQFVASSKGVGSIQRQVFWPFLRMVQVPVPNLKEQGLIVNFLTNETQSLNTAIARTEQEIEMMREYSTRLTADVVTGKLDVRATRIEDVEEKIEDSFEKLNDSTCGESAEAYDE
jgi:type I restriction enzyme S subunit